uniref:Uncharacterized protein n=1 Tax=Kalanchoe fedtschenkoi TaxID=63787 RepID=A0A7N0VLP6_KALFE
MAYSSGISSSFLNDGEELLTSVAHPHDGHPKSIPIEELKFGLVQNGLRERGGFGDKGEDPIQELEGSRVTVVAGRQWRMRRRSDVSEVPSSFSPPISSSSQPFSRFDFLRNLHPDFIPILSRSPSLLLISSRSPFSLHLHSNKLRRPLCLLVC